MEKAWTVQRKHKHTHGDSAWGFFPPPFCFEPTSKNVLFKQAWTLSHCLLSSHKLSRHANNQPCTVGRLVFTTRMANATYIIHCYSCSALVTALYVKATSIFKGARVKGGGDDWMRRKRRGDTWAKRLNSTPERNVGNTVNHLLGCSAWVTAVFPFRICVLNDTERVEY